MTNHLPSSLQVYLAGLGTATVLATTSNAAIVMMDVSSISGINGGLGDGIHNVSLSNLTSGALTGSLTIWNSGYIGFESNLHTLISAEAHDYAGPKAFQTGAMIDDDSANDFALSNTFYTMFSHNGNSFTPSWGNGSYLGFSVYSGGVYSGGDHNYGWLEVTWNSETKEFQVLSGAFESEFNTGIEAGAIPEPSSLALLAAGAAGVAALRRKKKAA